MDITKTANTAINSTIDAINDGWKNVKKAAKSTKNAAASGWEKTPTAVKVAGIATMILVMAVGTTVLALHLSGNLQNASNWMQHSAAPATRDFFAQSVDAKVWEIAAAGTGLAALGALGGALGARAYYKNNSKPRTHVLTADETYVPEPRLSSNPFYEPPTPTEK